MKIAISIIVAIVLGLFYAQWRWSHDLGPMDLSHERQQRRAKSAYRIYYRGRRRW